MDSLLFLATFCLPLLVMVGLSLARLDEIFVVRIEGGKVELVRGRISPALYDELRDIVRRFPAARGTLRGLRRQPHPELAAEGLPEALAQRARNVFALHAPTLLARATLGARRRRFGARR